MLIGSVNPGTEGISGGSDIGGSANGEAAARASMKPKVIDTADMVSVPVGRLEAIPNECKQRTGNLRWRASMRE